MTALEDWLARIHGSERGAHVIAALDYDGTLIEGFSAKPLYDHRLKHLEMGPLELARVLLAAAGGISTPEEFAKFLDISLEAWRGRPEEELADLGRRLFKHVTASRLRPEMWRIVQAHRRMGHTIVLASSATRYQLDPVVEELDAQHGLCTALEIEDGLLTGRTAGPALWGPEKASGLEALARATGADLADAFGYSNGDEDVPFLDAVGVPVSVNPESDLERTAEERDWPILRCAPRGGRPGVRDVVRTAALYGGMGAGACVGFGVGVLRRSRSVAVDLASGPGADLGLALSSIDVDVVQGAEHLWSARPCVFVFNHQSKLDVPIMMKLLRSSYTGVAKAQAKHIPVFGQVFQLAGVAFVERGDTDQAKRALEPAVAKVREERMSLVLSPEGTRSVTPRLGPFKKGAFHIAMQAEVPMVPVVIRNAYEVMWRGAQTVRPGRVEVAVLPPVDTADWSVKTIEDHVAEVRGMFLETLDNWPTEAFVAVEVAS